MPCFFADWCSMLSKGYAEPSSNWSILLHCIAVIARKLNYGNGIFRHMCLLTHYDYWYMSVSTLLCVRYANCLGCKVSVASVKCVSAGHLLALIWFAACGICIGVIQMHTIFPAACNVHYIFGSGIIFLGTDYGTLYVGCIPTGNMVCHVVVHNHARTWRLVHCIDSPFQHLHLNTGMYSLGDWDT